MTRRPNWSGWCESNTRSPSPKLGGLATFPHPVTFGALGWDQTSIPWLRTPGPLHRRGQLVGVAGFEPAVSRVRGEHFCQAKLHPVTGASNGDRTRLSLLDRQVPSPDDYRRKLEDAEGIEPVLISRLKGGCLHQQATRPLVHAGGVDPPTSRLSAERTEPLCFAWMVGW
jgi:hypothetical protein